MSAAVADEAAASERLPGLDGLRAVAILMVIAWHGASRDRRRGWAGVDLFFPLSGFLITTLLLREEATDRREGGEGRFRLGAFYARRALRILPRFCFVLGLNVLVLVAPAGPA